MAIRDRRKKETSESGTDTQREIVKGHFEQTNEREREREREREKVLLSFPDNCFEEEKRWTTI